MKRPSCRVPTLFVIVMLAGCAAQQYTDNPDDAVHTADEPSVAADAKSIEGSASAERRLEASHPVPLEKIGATAKKADALDEAVPSSVTSTSNGALAQRPPAASLSTVSLSCCAPPPYRPTVDTEQYEHRSDNPLHLAAEEPVSTFSIDVDTGSYANVRRMLNAGRLPPQDAVRVEEMINYFDYRYTPPANRQTPFRVATELAHTPWNTESLLLKIGIKGYEIDARERPASNLVFLIDVSGSMQSPDKLPLLKNAFRLLTEQLTAKDCVSLVVYAGNSGVVLEPTRGDRKQAIMAAIDRLEAGGSTNGAAGIRMAYQLARDAYIDGGINRVILATDGDFNVGAVNFEALVDMAERERASGIAITTLGFGTGNYNDKLMERLADAGNGNYAYVDNLSEARKVLVNELSATLYTIAKDVKIQVEFNPAAVLEYRLIGYENRLLAREDFNNDKVDAGEIGAGHRVTALYEIVPVGRKGLVDPLRYGPQAKAPATSNELADIRLRYKRPDVEQSTLLEYPVLKSSLVSTARMSNDFKLAASVAAFGQLLRGGKYLGGYSYGDVAALAGQTLSDDSDGYRREFVSLVKLADSLTPKRDERVGRVE